MSANVSKCFSVALAKVLNSQKYDSDIHLQGKTTPFIGDKSNHFPRWANKNADRHCNHLEQGTGTVKITIVS